MAARVLGICRGCQTSIGTRMNKGVRVAYVHLYYGTNPDIAIRGERCPGSGQPARNRKPE